MIELNKDKAIHFIGIGGIGMSAIAAILIDRGYKVSGSDMNKSEKVEELEKLGAKIFIGHFADNVTDAQLVIYTAAVSSENPEIIEATRRGIPTYSRAKMLGQLMREHEHSIAVAGTHGKTSTTSMISLILDNGEKKPTILVGGNLVEIGGNVKVGEKEFFVTEACEYMDSFLELEPTIQIILNIDSDHLDYFKDIDHITASFDAFVEKLPEHGILFAYNANPFVNRVMEKASNCVTFGLSEDCDYMAEHIEFSHTGMPEFDLICRGEKLCKLKLSVPGEYNILNALAAAACCHTLGVEIDAIKSTLEKFTGTQRRFDIQGTTSTGMTIIDDYAHHPTEIKSTLSGVKNIKHNKTWCLFQPHTYTRTLALFDEFPESFADADKIIITDIYAAREKNIYGISSEELVKAIKEQFDGKDVWYIKTFEEIADFVYENGEARDLVLTMGAGDIYKVGQLLLDKEAN